MVGKIFGGLHGFLQAGNFLRCDEFGFWVAGSAEIFEGQMAQAIQVAQLVQALAGILGDFTAPALAGFQTAKLGVPGGNVQAQKADAAANGAIRLA